MKGGVAGRCRWQPADFNQILKANQSGVAGMHRHALIRGTVRMRRPQWQHLPDADASCLQEINKVSRILANSTLPSRAG